MDELVSLFTLILLENRPLSLIRKNPLAESD